MNQIIDRAGLAVIAFLVEKYDLQDLLGALASAATERAQETGDTRLRALSTAMYRFNAELTARPRAGSLPGEKRAKVLYE